MKNAQKTAFAAGVSFAKYLNETSSESQNYSPLVSGDDIPEFDYIELRNEFGDVTKDVEKSYFDGFNSVFGKC